MDGRYPPYPQYKPSGVEWLGEIPAHWDVRRLKFVARFAYGDSLSAVNREEGNVPVFGSNGIVGMHNQANTLAPCIVIGRKGSFGKVNYSYTPVFAIDTTFYVDRRCTKQDLRWLYYVLGLLGLDESSQDSAVPGLSREFAYNQAVPFPDLAEQRAIAAYLDRETAHIDALIAHKRDLLALLERQRAALISHAVTKGLNPDVPRKPSGVEWLGEIPSHWDVRRLKFVAGINSETLPEIMPKDYAFTYIDIGNVSSDGVISEPQEYTFETAPTRARRKVTTGDTIISTVRTYLQAIAYIDERYSNCIVSTGFAVLRPQENLYPKFLYYLVRSKGFVDAVMAHSNGVSYPAINPSTLAGLWGLLPPLPEQRAIAAYLDRETARIDRLKAEIEASIELLGRYRAALISAAVTGKIRVVEN